MSKRNLILLIIIFIIVLSGILLYFYFTQPEISPTGESTGESNFLSQFNPFSTNPTTPTPPVVTPPVENPGTLPTAEIPEVILKKISSMPVAGYGIYKKERFKEIPAITEAPAEPAVFPTTPTKPTPPPTEFVTALRYVARASGNIYQTFADKIDERKFSSTVIPKIYEAYFGNRGESVVMRYLKADDNTIETFVGSLPKEVLGEDTTENNEVKGSFLPENIADVSISPDNLKLFYLLNIGDNVIGTTSGLVDNKKVQVFDSPFTEWLSWWPRAGAITLTTRPSAFVPGYMYMVDPGTKKLTKVLAGIAGLTTLMSPDGKLVIYGSNDLSLNVYDTATKSSSLLGVRTLPEKCTWDKTSTFIYCAVPKQPAVNLPDSWYKGEISFSDEIWKTDVKTGNTALILDPVSLAGVEEIDGIKLTLDEDDNYLFLVNKKDSYLWELELK